MKKSRRRRNRNRSTSTGKRASAGKAMLGFETLEARHLLATLVVNSTADTLDLTDSVVTLRDAIQAANTDALVAPGGPTGSGADTITFSSLFDAAQTIELVGQLPTITDALTITGPGANLLTLDAGNGTDDTFDTGDGFRIFNIDGGTNAQIDVALSGLTLTGADVSNYGGAIFNRENLTITNSTLSGNSADYGGGIFNYGTVNVTSSTLSGNSADYGGGIYNANNGTANVTSSTLSGNSADRDGGGIFNSVQSTANVTSSTLSGNSAGISGGGIFNLGIVSGFIPGGTANVTSSTLSGNSAGNSGGGIYNSGGNFYSRGTANVTSSTLSGNSAGNSGGGIYNYNIGGYNSGEANVTSSIVAGNTLSNLTTESNVFGFLNTDTFNLLSGDPMLGPLADNGGLTQTHALLPGSPAINAGALTVTNVAGDGTTSESSASNGRDGSLAVDGNFTNTTYTDGANDTAPFWQVDWASDFAISEVVLHNRTQFVSRLRDITVEIFDAAGNSVFTSALLNPENILGNGASNQGPATLTVDLVALTGGPVVGRAVRVSRTVDPDNSGIGGSGSVDDQNVLSLAEVEVFASIVETPDQRGFPFVRNFGGGVDIGAYESQTLDPSFLVVTTATDELNYSNNEVSLREAMELANVKLGADTITFSSLFDAAQTIELVGQLPTITVALTITGPGANLLTLDAGNGTDDTFDTGDGFRIFNIDDGDDSSRIDVALSGLTLTGGDVSNYGGAIRNRENLTITSSTLSGNSALLGGGIVNFGTSNVTSSTLSGNSAGVRGGGIYNGDYGTANVTSSTLSGNSAVLGGGIYNFGTANVTSSTLSGNSAFVGGGGIANYGPANITSSIVAGNTFPNVLGFLNTKNTFNLFSDDPMLGPLADNGGPTQTHALLPGSPAINAGDPNAVAGQNGVPQFDQRGSDFDRLQFGQLDLGAFELQASLPAQGLVVSTNTDVSDFDFSPGELSLREAVLLANNVAGADTITFSSLFDAAQTIELVGQLPTITDAVTITGPGANLLTLDAGNGTDDTFDTGDGFQIFNIDDGTSAQIDVALSGLTLTGADVSNYGGAIFNRENLTITSSTLSGNSAIEGGGIINYGTVNVTSSTFSGNSAGLGGGIMNRGTANVTSSTLSGNSAEAFGGGIHNAYNRTMTITSSTISGNSAGGEGGSGGGISNDGTATITNSTLSGNSAYCGGGIMSSGTANITSSTISGNSAVLGGGGIYNSFGTANVTNSIVANSTSGGDLYGSFSGSFNLIGDGQNLGSLTDSIIGDAMLGPLADNGGPTQTHALLPGSPAIDAGDPNAVAGQNGVPLFDQRGSGFDRVQVGRLDIGAYESDLMPANAPQVVNATVDEGGVLVRPDLWRTLTVEFDQDVAITGSALSLANDTLGGTAVDLSGVTFDYDDTTFTATWTFDPSNPLPAAFYTYTLDASLITAGGLSLDANGDGTGGDDLVTQHYVAIPGDLDLDGDVDIISSTGGDGFIFVQNLGTTSGATWATGDFDGDGDVDIIDSFPAVGDGFIFVQYLGQSVVPTANSALSQVLATSFVSIEATTSAPRNLVIIDDTEDDEERFVESSYDVKTAATPELSGDQARDDAFASEFTDADLLWA